MTVEDERDGAPDRGAIRREVLRLALLIIAVDAVAVGAYYLLHIASAVMPMRRVFTIAWTAVTVAVVSLQLRRIRLIRYRRR